MIGPSVKTFFPDAPRPAESIEPVVLYLYKAKYPELFAHIVLSACVKKQTAFLVDLWALIFPPDSDPCVPLTWEFVAARGDILDYLNLDDEAARQKFDLLYNAVSKGYYRGKRDAVS